MEVQNRPYQFQLMTMIGLFAFAMQSHAQATSIDISQVQASAGCNLKASEVVLKSSEIRIPIKLSAVLDSEGGAPAISRKSCVISLPIEVPATHGLQVDSFQVEQSQKLTVGTDSNLQVEVFKAGTQGMPLKIEKQATSKVLISKSKASQKTSVLFGCGQSGILRINSSVLLKSDLAESASAASLSKLRLRYKLIPCQK
jgi:hypothetical protein